MEPRDGLSDAWSHRTSVGKEKSYVRPGLCSTVGRSFSLSMPFGQRTGQGSPRTSAHSLRGEQLMVAELMNQYRISLSSLTGERDPVILHRLMVSSRTISLHFLSHSSLSQRDYERKEKLLWLSSVKGLRTTSNSFNIKIGFLSTDV